MQEPWLPTFRTWITMSRVIAQGVKATGTAAAVFMHSRSMMHPQTQNMVKVSAAYTPVMATGDWPFFTNPMVAKTLSTVFPKASRVRPMVVGDIPITAPSTVNAPTISPASKPTHSKAVTKVIH